LNPISISSSPCNISYTFKENSRCIVKEFMFTLHQQREKDGDRGRCL
jgi:hypothetical protein